MKPIDEFLYVRQNYLLPDTVSLMRFYLPIIGSDATALYQYFISFFDNGEKRHKFSEILNHTQFGMSRFEENLSVLTAMDLVAFYQKDGLYYVKLQAPLTAEDFCKNAVYRNLLEQKIGQVALEHLELALPRDVSNLSKRFSDVFGHTEQPLPQQSVKSKTDFDLDSFKQLMTRDGLQFADEQKDVIDLYVISEKYKLTWYETYLLAKETASRHRISTERMRLKKEQIKSDKELSQFSKEEQTIIHAAKSDRPEVLLAKVKKMRHAAVTADERKLLADLAEKSFLDEVINVMVLYTVSKTDSANLNKRYLMKIANDFSYQKVTSAEQAVEKMRAFSERRTKQNQAKTKTKSNVPEWSNQDYKNETTADEQARLDEIKRQTLARLRKDGDE